MSKYSWFPQTLNYYPSHLKDIKQKGYGGWTDPRDIELCLEISKGTADISRNIFDFD